MNDEMFYGTLPQDTQDFSQVLRGVGRSIKDIGRGVSYYPYDLLGAPVDIINMALQPVGLGSERPVMGSDYLRNIAQSLGYAQPSTGSGAETAARFAAGLTNPAAGARAVGQAGNLVTKGANLSADRLVQMITGNPQATAPRVLEETSMPFMQAMAPKTPAPSLLEPTKSDIGFYSQLEAATIPLQNKGTGDQYLAQISKTAGVKPEEIQWTGLDEFLKGKKSVSKDEILNYLNTNRVDVQEVRLGRTPAMVQAERDAAFGAYDRGEITLEQRNAILEQSEPATTRHHLGAYGGIATEIPGGENYREILLTLPQKGRDDLIAAEQKRDMLAKQTADMMEEWKSLSEQMPGDPRVVELYQRLSETRRQRDNAVVDARELRAASEAQTYRSSHFNQPNILAHMRVNDRVVDGKKTLFIEEIQSDWHQAGRKRGYLTPSSRSIRDIENEASEVNRERARLITEAADLPDSRMDEFNAMNARIRELTARARELGDEFDTAMRPKDNVPDAPFKTSWHELSLKRAIQEASEKGYDQIAFTTGKTQAERYDLSKQVDSVLYFPETKTVVAYKNKEIAAEKRLQNDSELEEVIGKDAARKLLEQPTKSVVNARGDKAQTISGVDLQVGGEGMKGFYDNILPKSLDKLAKKFDAKVGKTFIEGERTRDASGIPSMYPEKIEVWSMDITPKMRESVTTKGQPLFAVPAVGAGLLGASMMQDEEMY